MNDFQRRSTDLDRHPRSGSPEPDSTTGTAKDGSSGLGWQAAQTISRLSAVEPGTVIKVVVETTCECAVLEVSWDVDGIVVIREL
jgi:hypothetical protein